MDQDTTLKAADLLMAVRAGGAKLAGLGAAAPQTEAGAWAVQREVLRRLGGRIGGYKCAAPPGRPHTAAILAASGVVPGPAEWAVPAGEKIGIETEIAFRFARDLPPRATPYSEAEVLDAVEGCFPAIEMVISRYTNPGAMPPWEAMADNVAHAGLVVGADVPGWRDLDLAGLTVRQSCGGAVQVEKVGGNPSGGPFVALLWLANHLPTVGLHIQAGQVVTTGSCTGLLWVESQQQVTGGFQGFGEVVVNLA
ncbi:2-keto-4-pentenoate hydratase [Humitalea rosea]|uniref:2-keto-4-pentenoate hydratase n=1 Tax=Humitalea rosea TaxID=990373 RepID=A0A2W7HTH1_9PROT|nr:fumarylacetoacetate hydrolase family protein [Humitalea rosea]PZW36984.1 2-keto-4-pentenoate hydratase [Humitalea rosea]